MVLQNFPLVRYAFLMDMFGFHCYHCYVGIFVGSMSVYGEGIYIKPRMTSQERVVSYNDGKWRVHIKSQQYVQ